MSLLIIIILGIIQGACEFLPVSSSGHLVLFYKIFSVSENTILLSIILHMATLLSIIVVYRKQLLLLIKKPFCKTNFLLLTSTIFTVIVFMIIEKFVVNSFSGQNLIYFFLITAVILLFSEMFSKSKNRKAKLISQSSVNNLYNKSSLSAKKGSKFKDMFYKECGYDFNISYPQAIIVGLCQGIATIPGISRSGLTISGGLVAGINKDEVANYSFLLSLPVILASLGYEIFKINKNAVVFDFSVIELFIGFIVAFLVGLLCLKVMVRFVKKQKLYVFSIYLVLLVITILLTGVFR